MFQSDRDAPLFVITNIMNLPKMSAALISDLSPSWVSTVYVKTFKPEYQARRARLVAINRKLHWVHRSQISRLNPSDKCLFYGDKIYSSSGLSRRGVMWNKFEPENIDY